eukprot:9479840-Pyramimonas_sp.AAC.1
MATRWNHRADRNNKLARRFSLLLLLESPLWQRWSKMGLHPTVPNAGAVAHIRNKVPMVL